MPRPVLAGTIFVVVVALAAAGIAIPLIARDGDSPPASGPAGAASSTPPVAATASPPGVATAVPRNVRYQRAFAGLPILERPVAMLEVPGEGTMLVALQDGRILAFARDDPANVATVLDQRSRTSRSGEEEGLLSIALDPDFGNNGYLYAYYSATPGERRTVLSRFETRGEGTALRADAGSEVVLLTVPQPFSNHKGGTILFDRDGLLYLSLGDGGSGGDPNGNGQDISRNLLGSIIRIDVRGATAAQPYRVPADNPFAGASAAKGETWAFGFRNPWRMSFDRATGALWVADVGEGAREEIDLVRRGGNYGWNVREGTECFRPASGCASEGLVPPVAEYETRANGCAITGGYVYRGRAFSAMQGVYFYADYCSGRLWGLLAAPAYEGGYGQPTQILSEGPMVASFAEDNAGELYALAFDGRIYRLVAE